MLGFAAVIAGGAIGSVLRYLIYILLGPLVAGRFPVATFTVNILGGLAIGGVSVILPRYINAELLRLFIVTGILGGFTTFSAFEIEAADLLKDNLTIALIYIGASVVIGISAVLLGRWAAAQAF